jgi:hypothetical protein
MHNIPSNKPVHNDPEWSSLDADPQNSQAGAQNSQPAIAVALASYYEHRPQPLM